MSNTVKKISVKEKDALEKLASDSELMKFEKQLSGINFFEIVGMERSEIRHSTFLAWLLNPYAEHGLSDFFLRRLLQKLDFSNQALSSFEIATLDLTDAICETEKYFALTDSIYETEKHNANTKGRIDIFIQSQNANLAIFIENKVDSSEGKGQLEKYKKASLSLAKENTKAFIYLTKDGDTPSDSDCADYMALSYKNISEIINDCLDLKADSLSDEAEMILKHYDKMLKRNIIPDESFLQDIRSFYKTHKVALDKIEDFRTGKKADFKNAIKDKLEKCIVASQYMYISSMLRFIPKEFQHEKIFELGSGWSKSEPQKPLPFMFKVVIDYNKAKVLFCIGDIDKSKKIEIFDMLDKDDDLKKTFKKNGIKFSINPSDRKYVHIARKTLVRYNIETDDIEDVLVKIEKSFENYKTVIKHITDLLAKNFIGG